MSLSIISLLVLFSSLSLKSCEQESNQLKQEENNTATLDTLSGPDQTEIENKQPQEKFVYDFQNPSQIFDLPKELNEISGLVLIDDGHLGAIQDERGILYILDAVNGEVNETIDFEGKGDYEGVALAGDRMYVARSDGKIFELQNWRTGSVQVREFEADVKKKCDLEGLAYDAANQRLLFSCKEDAGNDLDGRKAIYGFYPADERLEGPLFVIDLKEVENRQKNLDQFKPSALEIHPVTQQIYVISSNKQGLVVLDRNGTLSEVYELPGKLFEQPEGITFRSDGTLFISNERGGEKNATLLRFDLQ